MSQKPRVVVTGVGIVSCIGNTYLDVQKSLHVCKDGLGPVTIFSTSAIHPVGEAQIDASSDERKFRIHFLADHAIQEALLSSGLLAGSNPWQNIGIALGTCTSGMLEMEESFFHLRKGEENKVSISKPLSMGVICDDIASKYNISGRKMLFSTACSSSSNAIACAFHAIREKECNAMIAGGADALCRLTYYGFQSLKIMAENKCTPFSSTRKGMNLGEGSGILILESLDHALKRGAKIYAEIAGVGTSADAYHMSAPDPMGRGAYQAMKIALDCASILPKEIDYISTHGTGTLQNDEVETIAIQNLFDTYCHKPWVNSIKSYLGHTLGSSGAIASVCAISSLETNFIPPTLRLENIDPKCNLHHSLEKGVHENINTALVNSFGFGGNNTSLVFKKFYE